jgi:mannitol/fructose-specific phosphotransferase system IIA component (Ntr-type)
MDLQDYFDLKPDTITLRATDRWAAIDELIAHLIATHQLKPEHRDAIAAVVKNHENAMSTGIGFGIALPYAATELVSEVIAVLGRSPTGIEFDAIDGKPVKKVLLFLVPTGQFKKFSHILAELAKRLHRESPSDDH